MNISPKCIPLLLLAINVFCAEFSRVDILDGYVQLALDSNPELMALKKSSEAAKQRIHQAGSWAYPKLDFGIFPQPMELANGKQIAQVSLMQMFSLPGVNASLKDEAKVMSKMEEFRVQRFEDSLAVKVITMWYNLCALKQKQQIFKENKTILEQLEQLYMSSYSAGNGAEQGISAVFAVQAELLESDYELENIQNELTMQTAEFNALLGREHNITINVADSLEILSLNVAGENDKPVMLEMQEFEREIISAQRNMNLKMTYPMFGLGLQYSLMSKIAAPMDRGMNGKDMFMIMGSIELPLWRKRTNAIAQEAELLLQASELRLGNMRNMLGSGRITAKNKLQSAMQKISLLKKQTELLNSGYEISVKNFSVGGNRNFADVLQTKKQFLYYKLQMIETIAMYNSIIADEFILWHKVKLVK